MAKGCHVHNLGAVTRGNVSKNLKPKDDKSIAMKVAKYILHAATLLATLQAMG